MVKKVVWKGIFPAICMPLAKDYSVDEPSLRRYANWISKIKGLSGIVINGHASEVTTFSREERNHITKIVVDEIGKDIPIICGVNCEGTMEAIRHAIDAKENGASAVMLQPSHMWLRSGVNTQTAVSYVRDVADSIGNLDLAIQVYQASCKATYSLDALMQMALIPNVRAFKLGIRDSAVYEKAIRLLRSQSPHISLFTCYDEALVSSMMHQIDGALVGIAGAVPELVVEAWEAVQSGDWKRIRECEMRVAVICDAIYGTKEISSEAHARAKELLHQRNGIPSGLARRPVLPLSNEEKQSIAQAIEKAGLKQIDLNNQKS